MTTTEGIYSDMEYFNQYLHTTNFKDDNDNDNDNDYIELKDEPNLINFQIDETAEQMEYNENPKYFINKAISNWGAITENTDPVLVSEWIPKYKKYLEGLLHVNDLVLFNGLSNFKQVVSICNSYHQKKLLKDWQFECNCYVDDIHDPDDHYYNYMKDPFLCTMFHKIMFNENDAGYYDYVGFISEKKPSGVVEYLF